MGSNWGKSQKKSGEDVTTGDFDISLPISGGKDDELYR